MFKLYAGGRKSTSDILELLTRTKVDLDRLKALARDYGFSRDLKRVLALVEARD